MGQVGFILGASLASRGLIAVQMAHKYYQLRLARLEGITAELGVPSRCSLNMVNSLGLQLVVGKPTSFDVRQSYLSATTRSSRRTCTLT